MTWYLCLRDSPPSIRLVFMTGMEGSLGVPSWDSVAEAALFPETK